MLYELEWVRHKVLGRLRWPDDSDLSLGVAITLNNLEFQVARRADVVRSPLDADYVKRILNN